MSRTGIVLAGMLLAVLLLGLFGSLGHCVGMCTGVMVLLTRAGASTHRARFLLHLGRISSYCMLGMLAGTVGSATSHMAGHAHGMAHASGVTALPFSFFQGAMALAFTLLAAYMALALLGHVPAPDILLVGVMRHWSKRMRKLSFSTTTAWRHPLAFWLGGLLWGLLPCGLVLTALLAASATLSTWFGALAMLLFGLGTLPALLITGWLAQGAMLGSWPRYIAAGIMVLFGVQMALRGFAAWGWVEHLHLQGMMLW